MDDSLPSLSTRIGERGAPTLECVDERARPVSGGRMDDHARWLVDDEHVIVLVAHGEWNRFGEYYARRRRRNAHRDPLPGPGAIACLLASAVDGHTAVRDERRRLIAGEREMRGDEDVESRGVVRCDELVRRWRAGRALGHVPVRSST